MRLIDIFSPAKPSYVLMERIVVNIGEVKEEVERYSEYVEHPTAKKWFRSQLLSYAVNRMGDGMDYGGEVRQVNPERIRNPSPWIQKEINAGAAAYMVNFGSWGSASRERISDIIRWLNWTFLEASRPPSRINLTWEQALQKINNEDWSDHGVARRKSEKEMNAPSHKPMEGEDLIMEFPNGFSWVMLETPECWTAEGERMGNCLRHGEGQDEYNRVYSLRDKNNKSHMTVGTSYYDSDGIIMDDTEILLDIEGKGGSIPKMKYVSYLKDLMSYVGFVINPTMPQGNASIMDTLYTMEHYYDDEELMLYPYESKTLGEYEGYSLRLLNHNLDNEDSIVPTLIVLSSESNTTKAMFYVWGKIIKDMYFIIDNRKQYIRLARLGEGQPIKDPLSDALEYLLFGEGFKISKDSAFLATSVAEFLDTSENSITAKEDEN